MMHGLGVIALQAVLAAAPVVTVDVPVPGGIAAAAEAIGLRTVPDRGRFVAEIARAVYEDSTLAAAPDSRQRRLLAHFFPRGDSAPRDALDLVPVALTPAIWSQAVFHRQVPAGELFATVACDRDAALLAYGLSALDDETLRFLSDHPALVERIYRHDAAVFASFAEHLHVHDNRVVPPGGDRAVELWEGLIEERLTDPEQFVARLFDRDSGRTAYLYDTIGHLDPDRAAFALGLWIVDRPLRLNRFKALAAAADAVYPQWNPRRHLFRRPPHDLMSMLWRLRPASDGQLAFPAWRAVLSSTADLKALPAQLKSIDAASLVRATLGGDVPSRGVRLDQLAFGERVFAGVDAAATSDAVAAIAGFPRYPTLLLTIERVGTRRAAIYAALARHADRLSPLEGATAHTALAQFQGALAVVARLARVRAVEPPTAERLLDTLAGVPIGTRGYAGALAEWIQAELLRALPHGEAAESVLLSALAGVPSAGSRPPIVWEGREYWFDPAASEALRLRRIRDRIDAPTLDVALSRLAAARAAGAAREAADQVHSRVDVPLGEALLALAYAVDLGNADGTARLAGNLPRRHDFTAHQADADARARVAWSLPRQHFDASTPWHVDGSALALDVALAPLLLQRVGAAPPSRPPALALVERDAFAHGVALLNPIALDDATLDAIAGSVARGQQRVSALASGGENPETLARAIRMDGARARALRWAREHEPNTVASFFDAAELFALGGGVGDLRPWGVSPLNYSGCLCVDVPPVGKPTALAGRPRLGLFSTAAADLNLRVALVVRDMALPAALASAVLAFAVRDFIDEVQPNDSDDWLTLVRAARAVSRDRVEDYVAAAAAGGGPLIAATPSTAVHNR